MPPKKKVRRYSQMCLTKVDKGRHYSDSVGNEMYQLQLVVVQKTPEEVARGEVEATLKVRREDDLLLHVLGRELLPHRCPAVFHSTSTFGLSSPRSTKDWILASDIVDRTHTVRGSRIGVASVAISLQGFDLDLKEHKVLMSMRSGARHGAAALARGWPEPMMGWTRAQGKQVQGYDGYGVMTVIATGGRRW
jgi:hypothetical protein